MPIHILDHRLNARTGHRFDFCHVLAQGLVAQGQPVEVCGHCGAQPDVAPAFTGVGAAFIGLFSRFDHPAPPAAQDPAAEDERLAREIAAEMDGLGSTDFLFFPTLTPELFLAYTWLEHPAPMLGVVHVAPDFLHAAGGRIWAAACRRARLRKLAATIGAIDPLLGEYLRTFDRHLPVVELPIPIGGRPRQDLPPFPRTIGFFGHQRGEKQKHLLQPLVGQLLAMDYRIVYHDTRGLFEGWPRDPRLRLVPFVEDLGAEMATCDLIVCLMNPAKYALRLSGIACHAIAAGLPVLLPAGTLSAVRFRPFGSCGLYADPSVTGIVQAIIEMATRYPDYAQAALSAARHWNRQHGLAPFIQALQACRQPPSP